MKRIFNVAIAIAVSFAALSCQKFDPSELWDSINSLEERVSDIETVLEAYENNLFIDKVTEIENGYQILFSDGSQATIINGEDGKDGDTYIKNITIGTEAVTFVLSDGKIFQIPLIDKLSIKFSVKDLVAIEVNSTREIVYTITSETETALVEVVPSGNIKAEVVKDDASGLYGKIQVTAGEEVNEDGKIIVFVSNGDKVIMHSINFTTYAPVKVLQEATVGNGINVVLMGDAYSDQQILDGSYEAAMQNLYKHFFTIEPYMSFKDYFEVSYVNVVSESEGYTGGPTALEGYFGTGTVVGGDDRIAIEYALKAVTEDEMDETLIIVAMNSEKYAGTCYMYKPDIATDYSSGVSVSYFSRGGSESNFAFALHHEACGHGFAKLADEYEGNQTISTNYATRLQSEQDTYGWWKNIDFTADKSAVRWSHFINDIRYVFEGIGTYQGGHTYSYGVWRPTNNSIMRSNVPDFNAPCREAIYYRIHKLAFGEEWEYDFEEFAQWDTAIFRSADFVSSKNAKSSDFEPLAPPVVVPYSWRECVRE